MWPDLLAFTSLSGLFVCEVVMVIKFLRVGKKKREKRFKGGLVGKRAVGDDTRCTSNHFLFLYFTLISTKVGFLLHCDLNARLATVSFDAEQYLECDGTLIIFALHFLGSKVTRAQYTAVNIT